MTTYHFLSRFLTSTALVALTATISFAQAPAGQAPGAAGRGAAPARVVLSVTSNAWPDGGEIPMKYSSRGENKSPDFTFNWSQGGNAVAAPPELQSYAIVFRDMENSTNKGTTDTLHWTIFNIPGTAKGIQEGLGKGDLPDGSRNGPGIANRGGNPGAYFGPGAGPGPFHHYVFEFFALDTKLDVPATATRDELLKAMEGHVIGKAVYTGRFHAPAP
jgi:Raf kinase inhibitor-like YbhB/YbcL family protein